MPELPEVEVSRLGITPWMEGIVVERVVIRHPRLRWPIPSEIRLLEGQPLRQIERRAKYLLLRSTLGTAILHLGMSGRLRILPIGTPAEKHDHVDLELANGKLLRFHDPRRFGALLWTAEDPYQHPLLKTLGPEPLTDAFTADYLWQRSRKPRSAIKPWLMDNRVVVGVGNIYANEALFMAHIHPKRAVNSLTPEESQALVAAVKKCLPARSRKAALRYGISCELMVNPVILFRSYWYTVGQGNLARYVRIHWKNCALVSAVVCIARFVSRLPEVMTERAVIALL